MAHTVIYGPPGTGKSHAIIERVKAAINSGCDPKRICLLSFTRTAAKELASRNDVSGIHVSTIHSLAFQALGMSKEQVVSFEDLNEFAKKTGFRFTHSSVECSTAISEGDIYLACYNKARACTIPPLGGYDTGIAQYRCNYHRYSRFITAYEQYKFANGLRDFSDMITEAAQLEGPEFDYVFIDEAQDLSLAQWGLVNCWISAWGAVCIAGDDDQSIYVWSGAHPAGMREFGERYEAENIVLSHSFRVPRAVHAKAQALISRVRDRVQKEYSPDDREGSVRHNMQLPAAISEIRHGDDVLVLYRNHSMSAGVQRLLRTQCVPYSIEGRRSPQEESLWRAAVAWKNAQKYGWDSLSISAFKLVQTQCAEVWEKAVRAKSREALKRPWHQVLKHDKDLTPYMQMIEDKFGLQVRPTVRLSTIHASKGKEADTVVLLNSISMKTMHACKGNMDPETRTFYVGVTRAKNNLIICNTLEPRCMRLIFL